MCEIMYKKLRQVKPRSGEGKRISCKCTHKSVLMPAFFICMLGDYELPYKHVMETIETA